MIQIFRNINVDWLAKRRIFLWISALMLVGGLASAMARQLSPGGTDAFNLGVDFKSGTQVTVRFRERPSEEIIRAALAARGLGESTVQATNRADEVLIRVPQVGSTETQGDQAQVDEGRARVTEVLSTLGTVGRINEGANIEIAGAEYVGPVAGRALRNQAITVTLLALVGILLYIGWRFEWTYGAAAVITVFHDVLVTLGFFSIFQIEINLTVVAALLTLVGFSVNDTIVTFDRVRENLRLHRRDSLYKITNDAINETMSRTVITGGLVFLSVLALVLFGGDVLRPFSLALFIGVIIGTYSTIAISNPIMVWWQQRVEAREKRTSDARHTVAANTRGPRTAKSKATAGGREPHSASRA
jgi:preprotein translocase subunit SecF